MFRSCSYFSKFTFRQNQLIVAKKIPVSDAKEIWIEAVTFEATSKAIHNAAYDQMEKGKEDLANGMSYAAFVNHAYSFELYLKCLTVIEYGYFYWGHELLELFNYLPQQTKDEIVHNNDTLTTRRKSVAQSMPEGGDFIQSLTDASNAFVDYRYLYDGEKRNEDYDLSFPMQFVKDMIIKKRPEFANR